MERDGWEGVFGVQVSALLTSPLGGLLSVLRSQEQLELSSCLNPGKCQFNPLLTQINPLQMSEQSSLSPFDLVTPFQRLQRISLL